MVRRSGAEAPAEQGVAVEAAVRAGPRGHDGHVPGPGEHGVHVGPARVPLDVDEVPGRHGKGVEVLDHGSGRVADLLVARSIIPSRASPFRAPGGHAVNSVDLLPCGPRLHQGPPGALPLPHHHGIDGLILQDVVIEHGAVGPPDHHPALRVPLLGGPGHGVHGGGLEAQCAQPHDVGLEGGDLLPDVIDGHGPDPHVHDPDLRSSGHIPPERGGQVHHAQGRADRGVSHLYIGPYQEDTHHGAPPSGASCGTAASPCIKSQKTLRSPLKAALISLTLRMPSSRRTM